MLFNTALSMLGRAGLLVGALTLLLAAPAAGQEETASGPQQIALPLLLAAAPAAQGETLTATVTITGTGAVIRPVTATVTITGATPVIGTVSVTATTPVTGTGAVTGTVSYRQRIALPSGAVVRVQVVDVARAGLPAQVIGEDEIVTTGRQPPIPFTVTYDPEQIRPDGIYVVQAWIEVAGELRFVTTSQVRVINHGARTGGIALLLDTAGGLPGNPPELPPTGRGTSPWPAAVAVGIGTLLLGGAALRRRLA